MKTFLGVSVFLFCSFFFDSTLAYAETMILSGWGESGVDGTYNETSDINTYPAYTNGMFYLCHYDVSHSWAIRSTDDAETYGCDDGMGVEGPAYYTDDNVSRPDLVSSWNVNWGDSPAGDIELGVDEEEQPVVETTLTTWRLGTTTCEATSSTTEECYYAYDEIASAEAIATNEVNKTLQTYALLFSWFMGFFFFCFIFISFIKKP